MGAYKLATAFIDLLHNLGLPLCISALLDKIIGRAHVAVSS